MRSAIGWLAGWSWIGLCGQAIALTIPSIPAMAGEPLTPLVADRNMCHTFPDPLTVTLEPMSCGDMDDDHGMAQMRSVAELSDIRPTDWAFQALQALVERYGVVTGFPDRTFRGNQALTRDEFAAALTQVFAKVEEMLESGQIAQIREDLNTLRRLQATYGRITVNLGDRLDQLRDRMDRNEERQFSTTTKLSGQMVGVLTDGSRARMTSVARVRLNLTTSFSGQDLLLTQLEGGNNGGDAVSNAHNLRQNLFGTTGLLAGGGGLDYVEVDGAVRLSKLYYTFKPAPSLSLTFGARLSPRDFIDDNRFANGTDRNFSSSFFMNNPLIVQNQIDRPGGAGAALVWKPANLPLALRAVYAAADADQTSGDGTDGGLFGDRYQGSLELDYALSNVFNLRLQFTRARINGTSIFAGGVNAEWAVHRQFALFGRYGIGTYQGFNPVLNQDLDLTPQTWAVGSIVRNIVIPGSTAGLAFGQPFVTGSLGNATQTNIEAFYSFLVNDNISFTPSLMVVTSPNNNRSSGTIWEFFIRMVFSF